MKKSKKNKAATQRIKDTAEGIPEVIFDVTLGGYGHKAGAKMAASNFMHPSVFSYQSAIFPSPDAFGVEVSVMSAEPVMVENAHPLNPWGVVLQMSIRGLPDKIAKWKTVFLGRVRLQFVA